jgi:hypothetical protein
MQAIELVTNDDFLAQFNLTIDTSDVVDYMRLARREWYIEDGKFIRPLGRFAHEFYFMERNKAKVHEVLTSRGFCYSFNIAPPSEVLQLERYLTIPVFIALVRSNP